MVTIQKISHIILFYSECYIRTTLHSSFRTTYSINTGKYFCFSFDQSQSSVWIFGTLTLKYMFHKRFSSHASFRELHEIIATVNCILYTRQITNIIIWFRCRKLLLTSTKRAQNIYRNLYSINYGRMKLKHCHSSDLLLKNLSMSHSRQSTENVSTRNCVHFTKARTDILKHSIKVCYPNKLWCFSCLIEIQL